MKQIKEIMKKVLVVFMIICALLPTLFSGIVFADDNNNLTTERAGNFAANFAINFYENWSSVSTVEVQGNVTSGTTGGNQGILDAANEIYTNLVNYHHNVRYIPYSMVSVSAIAVATDISSLNSIDCSSFTSGVLYKYFLDNQDKYGDTYNASIISNTQYTGAMKANCDSGAYTQYGIETYKNNNGTTQRWDGSKFVDDTSLASGIDFLQPGDIVVSDEIGHTNIFKEKADDSHYVAYDCGTYQKNVGWWNKSSNVEECLTTANNMWVNGAYVIRVPSNGGSSGSSTAKKYEQRGEIKTEYDSTINPKDDVNPKTEGNYKFNNISWIGFVYKNALFTSNSGKDINNILTDSENGITINTSNFDNKNQIPGVKEEANTSKIMDIATLISDGKTLPGDILYIEIFDADHSGSGQYLLYVGGTKVIYATEDPRQLPNGALKYELIENYLKRIRRQLIETYGKDADLPQYGVTQVYRINAQTAESLKESDTNLFFNGKGYYSKSVYNGMPKMEQSSLSGDNSFLNLTWLFTAIKQLFNFLVNLFVYMIRMQVIGWANLVENLLQHIILGLSDSNNDASVWDGLFGTNATSASGDRVTVESIFFNKIPFLDANFFNYKTAGGKSLEIEQEASGPVKFGENKVVTMAPDESNIVYKLRKNLNIWYVIIRNASIAILLFILIYLGIRLAITSSSEKKAEYKKLLISWVTAMIIVMFIHLFMYLVFVVNDYFVGVCRDLGETAAKASVSDLQQETQIQQEVNLYDAIRIKAYAFNWKEGVPATILYIFLIYLLVRFFLIYLKRYLTIYILALSGSFMGVIYAIEKINGKKTNTLNKWFKDFAFNVLLQTVHAFIYVIFMGVALSVSQDSLVGAGIAFVILNFMLKADKIIIEIFGLNKAGSLADVNNYEGWGKTLRDFMPIYTITTGAYGLVKEKVFGDYSLISRLRYMTTGKAEVKDAKKVLEQRKYNRIGAISRGLYNAGNWIQNRRIIGIIPRAINKTPIRQLWKYNQYYRKLGKHHSKDFNKQYYKAIKQAKKMQREKFTRSATMIKDFMLGSAGMVAATAVAIADPVAGVALYSKSKKTISKYGTMSRSQRKNKRYGASVDKTKTKYNEKRSKYNNAVNTYVNNQVNYEERMAELKDNLANATPNSEEVFKIKRAIDSLEQYRKKEEAKELHDIEETYQKMYESKLAYNSAKHERNPKTNVGKAIKDVTTFIPGVAATVTGASAIVNAIGDISAHDVQAGYKAKDSYQKQQKKLDDMSKVSDIEKAIKELSEQIKNKQKSYGAANGMSEEESDKVFSENIDKTVKAARKMDVKSSKITRAINEYMYENKIDKISEKDLDGVFNKLQLIVGTSGSKVQFTSEVREKVKKAFEEKMIEDKKGNGFDGKDATTTIRKALGDDGVITYNAKLSDTDPELKNLYDDLLHKIKQINTYNEIGKVKYKSSLSNINKLFDEIDKKEKK